MGVTVGGDESTKCGRCLYACVWCEGPTHGFTSAAAVTQNAEAKPRTIYANIIFFFFFRSSGATVALYMKGPKQKGDFSLENLVYCDEYPSTRGTVRAATRNAFMRLRTVLI